MPMPVENERDQFVELGSTPWIFAVYLSSTYSQLCIFVPSDYPLIIMHRRARAAQLDTGGRMAQNNAVIFKRPLPIGVSPCF